MGRRFDPDGAYQEIKPHQLVGFYFLVFVLWRTGLGPCVSAANQGLDPDGAYQRKMHLRIGGAFSCFQSLLENAEQVDYEDQGSARESVATANWTVCIFGWAD